ncbi:MAG: zf-HC2 domain-containing protein [Kofleriaceae bacterium]|nr:zf-HC2 domain-containing protein [Kofleriaceae bacterium]
MSAVTRTAASLCETIEPVAMMYLDDELAPEERRELELHLVDCEKCRAVVDEQRTDLDMMRAVLAPPPAPDMMKARIARALDEEDRQQSKADRRRWTRWMLPGSALIAAAAAIVVFVGSGLKPAEKPRVAAVAHEILRQQTRPLPLEVQGPSTGPWLKQHFAAVEPPQFTEPGIQLIGARATAVQGHDAAMLRYLVTVGVNRVTLTAVLITDLQGDELQGGQPVRVGGLTLHVYDADGQPAVTYVDEKRIGYVFTSERMTPRELLSLVVRSDFIGRAQQQLR